MRKVFLAYPVTIAILASFLVYHLIGSPEHIYDWVRLLEVGAAATIIVYAPVLITALDQSAHPWWWAMYLSYSILLTAGITRVINHYGDTAFHFEATGSTMAATIVAFVSIAWLSVSQRRQIEHIDDA
jgi:hypothetical protein